MEPSKVILTHWGALEAKYGTGALRIRQAVADLVAADARRGIGTVVVGIDRPDDLAPYGASPVRDPRDQERAKEAVDALDEAVRFHYYLLLGGPDIFARQSPSAGTSTASRTWERAIWWVAAMITTGA